MKSSILLSAYLFLSGAIALGIASNGFLKTTEGFTKLTPTLFSICTIVMCIFCLSKAMIVIPVGFSYATYGGLTITAVTIFGAFKYNQTPNIYSVIGIGLIIVGVVMVNYLGKVN
jgi:small multidrug resistance pump